MITSPPRPRNLPPHILPRRPRSRRLRPLPRPYSPTYPRYSAVLSAPGVNQGTPRLPH
ncbi:hypothetical protein 2016_scaffold57_00002 [Bacteriophage sp.]|nr:hypothetical protein 2016_scaffold57_00002 [Bacteriophage sp.]